MEARTIRQTRIILPGEQPGALDSMSRAPQAGERISEVQIEGDAWRRIELNTASISRSRFVGADLSSSVLDHVTLERCVFKNCTLVGTRWEGVKAKDVLLENCRLDYAFLVDVMANGPVAMIGCSLTEATFSGGSLSALLLDECKLSATTFDHCDLRGADLRGNDLSNLSGASALRGAVLNQSQLPGLTETLIRDLAIRIVPDRI